jgi:uncharacterized membrane protein YraQ (UPF0718 family)
VVVAGERIVKPRCSVLNYGWRTALLVTGMFYVAMILAGYAVELLLGATGVIPEARNAKIEAGISWNYTTWFNLALLTITAILLVRFVPRRSPASC